ncbi:hypothetical protein ACOSQ4_004871 [Xanthoceras sorbifolium]
MIETIKEVDTGVRGECKGMCVGVEFGEDDEVSVTNLSYERLSNFCGRVGHLLMECTENNRGLVEGPALKYEAWIKATPLESPRSRDRPKVRSNSSRDEAESEKNVDLKNEKKGHEKERWGIESQSTRMGNY